MDFNLNKQDIIKRTLGGNPSREDLQKRLDLHDKYSRLPFPNIVFENDTALFVVVNTEPSCWDLYVITPDGVIWPGFVEINICKENNTVDNVPGFLISLSELKDRFNDQELIQWTDKLSSTMQTIGFVTMEILLFMNTRNVKHVKYSPTKKKKTQLYQRLCNLSTHITF